MVGPLKTNAIQLNNVGFGLMNAAQDFKHPPGSAKVSKNFLHSTLENGQYHQAETRKYISRLWYTRPATAEVRLLAELRKKDGTRTLLVKIGTVLYSWTTNPATALTSIQTGLNTSKADWAQGFDRLFFTDASNKVYSTASNVFELTTSTRPTTAMTLTETGTANGFGTGAFEYNYTVYSSVEGWESRPRATSTSITKANANQGVRWANPSDGAITGIYDRYRLYRRLQGENAWYLIATINPASGFPYDDTTPDANLSDAALSEIHDNETGLDDFTPPGVFTAMAFYKGRVFGAVEDTLYWSKVGLPFLFRENEIARKRIGDDGDPIVAVKVVNESLVIFKRHSIWVMNGEAEETNFIFFPASRRIGAVQKLCVVPCPGGAIFVSSDFAVYFFDLTEESLRQPISFNQRFSLDVGTAASWCGGYCPVTRKVQLAMYEANASQPTVFYVAIDGFSWGIFESKYIYPTYYGEYLNEISQLKLIFGTEFGLGYQTEANLNADGVPAGTYTGTIASVTDQSDFNVSGSLFTTGIGLVGASITIKVNDGEWETREIYTNTSSNITTTEAFDTTLAVGMQYWIGAMECVLEFNSVRPSKEETRVDELQFSFTPRNQEWFFGLKVNDEETGRFVERSCSTGRCYARIPRRGYTVRPRLHQTGTGLRIDLDEVMFTFTQLRGKR